jgi:hypothetical protein
MVKRCCEMKECAYQFKNAFDVCELESALEKLFFVARLSDEKICLSVGDNRLKDLLDIVPVSCGVSVSAFLWKQASEVPAQELPELGIVRGLSFSGTDFSVGMEEAIELPLYDWDGVSGEKYDVVLTRFLPAVSETATEAEKRLLKGIMLQQLGVRGIVAETHTSVGYDKGRKVSVRVKNVSHEVALELAVALVTARAGQNGVWLVEASASHGRICDVLEFAQGMAWKSSKLPGYLSGYDGELFAVEPLAGRRAVLNCKLELAVEVARSLIKHRRWHSGCVLRRSFIPWSGQRASLFNDLSVYLTRGGFKLFVNFEQRTSEDPSTEVLRQHVEKELALAG